MLRTPTLRHGGAEQGRKQKLLLTYVTLYDQMAQVSELLARKAAAPKAALAEHGPPLQAYFAAHPRTCLRLPLNPERAALLLAGQARKPRRGRAAAVIHLDDLPEGALPEEGEQACYLLGVRRTSYAALTVAELRALLARACVGGPAPALLPELRNACRRTKTAIRVRRAAPRGTAVVRLGADWQVGTGEDPDVTAGVDEGLCAHAEAYAGALVSLAKDRRSRKERLAPHLTTRDGLRAEVEQVLLQTFGRLPDPTKQRVLVPLGSGPTARRYLLSLGLVRPPRRRQPRVPYKQALELCRRLAQGGLPGQQGLDALLERELARPPAGPNRYRLRVRLLRRKTGEVAPAAPTAT